jgi:hypothetical protein
VDGAKRIVPPLRGFAALSYRLPTADAVGYAVPPLAGLEKEKEKTHPYTTKGGAPARSKARQSNCKGNREDIRKDKAPVDLWLMFGFAIVKEGAAVA